MEVYKEKGSGFLEGVYHECLEFEFVDQQISYTHHPSLQITYKGRVLRQDYQPDFTCWDKIIIELKAVSVLNDQHRAQVYNYLKATGYKLGILINFGQHPKLEWERIVNDRSQTGI